MDIRTLVICYLSLLALNAAVLLVAHSTQRDFRGAGWLAGSFLSMMVGTGLLSTRGAAPDAWSAVAGNACTMLAYLLLHRAVTDFLGLGRRYLPAGLIISAGVLASAIYFTYGRADTPLRIAVVSIGYATQITLTASLLLRNQGRDGTRAAGRFLGTVLVILATLSVLRAALTLAYGVPADPRQGDPIQALSLLAFILTSTAITFGFIWMAGARLHAVLHRRANHDPLTGLLNRRGFLSMAPKRIRALRQERRGMLLLYADLDGLKQVNDTVGHDAGDRAICEAAEALREVLRASDSIARLGGDEFCALISGKGPENGAAILRRLQRHVEELNAQPGREYSIGISAAVVPVDPAERRSLEELLQDADRDMYAAKQARRRRIAG